MPRTTRTKRQEPARKRRSRASRAARRIELVDPATTEAWRQVAALLVAEHSPLRLHLARGRPSVMLAMRDAEMRQVMRTAMSYDGYVVAEARHDLELLVALVEMGQGLIPTPDLLVWDVALAPAEALTLVRRLHERGMALVLVPGQEAQRMWAEAAGERVRFCEGANAVVTYGAVCDLVPAPALSAASA